MLLVTLVCSDGDCDFVIETPADLEELDGMACACGCTLQVVAFSEGRELELRQAVVAQPGQAS